MEFDRKKSNFDKKNEDVFGGKLSAGWEKWQEALFATSYCREMLGFYYRTFL